MFRGVVLESRVKHFSVAGVVISRPTHPAKGFGGVCCLQVLSFAAIACVFRRCHKFNSLFLESVKVRFDSRRSCIGCGGVQDVLAVGPRDGIIVRFAVLEDHEVHLRAPVLILVILRETLEVFVED